MIIRKHVRKLARHYLLEGADTLRQLEKFSQRERLAMARRMEQLAEANKGKVVHVPCWVANDLDGFRCPVTTSMNIAEVLGVSEEKVVKEIDTLLELDDDMDDQFIGVTFETGTYTDDHGKRQEMYFLDHWAVELLLITRFWSNPHTRLALSAYGVAFRNPPVVSGVDISVWTEEK